MNSLPPLLVLATHNTHKADELAEMLSPFNITVQRLSRDPDVPEIIEDGTTFEENAAKKARIVSEYTGLPALADDSGLMVKALKGRPGVYSARFAGPTATDRENNRKLLEEMRLVPAGQRGAFFVSVIAFAIPGQGIRLFRGEIEGEILFEPRGSYGFGYDPLFYIPSLGKSMAELPPEEKNRISHRAKAYRALIEALRKGLSSRTISS